MVNRSAVLLRPRKPFLDWALAHGDGESYATTGERTVYLLPPYEDDVEAGRILRHFFDIIFEEELGGWMQDETMWPAKRTYAKFLEWFEVEHHSQIEDLVGGEALVDDEP